MMEVNAVAYWVQTLGFFVGVGCCVWQLNISMRVWRSNIELSKLAGEMAKLAGEMAKLANRPCIVTATMARAEEMMERGDMPGGKPN
jgi:hypothetical protein